MKCPRDHSELSAHEGNSDRLICHECGGIFLKCASLKAQIDPLLEKNKSAQLNAPEYLASPYDGKAMIPIKVKGVTIDLCQSSGYIWFDAGEYQRISGKQRSSAIDHIDNASTATDTALEVADFVIWDSSIIGDVCGAIGDAIGGVFKGIDFPSW